MLLFKKHTVAEQTLFKWTTKTNFQRNNSYAKGEKEAVTLTQLSASWDLRVRGNPWDHREHGASGELWDSTGFPSWSVTQSNGGAPQGLFRMSPQCNASSAAKQWLEASLWHSAVRDTQGACSFSHSIIQLELCYVITAPASERLRGDTTVW